MLTSILRNLNVLTIDLVTLLTSILRWMDGRINKVLCKHIIIIKKPNYEIFRNGKCVL